MLVATFATAHINFGDPSGESLAPYQAQDWERIEIRVRRLHAAAEDDFLVRNRPAQALDVPAANRFLAHALSGLNQEQRERLRRGEVAGQGEARQVGKGRLERRRMGA